MKKGIIYAGIMLVCTLFYLKSVMAQVPNVTLFGKTGSEISYIVLTIPTQYGISEIKDTLKVAPDKTFKYRAKIKTAGPAYLNYGDKNVTLWLSPGSILTINLQGESQKFKGKEAAFSAYYRDDKTFFSQIYKDYLQRNPKFNDNDHRFSDKYFAITDSMLLQRIAFLKKYFASANHPQDKRFVEMQITELVYANLYYNLAFDGSDVGKFKFYQDKYNLKRTKAVLFSEKTVFNNPGLLYSSYYRIFVNSLVMEMTQNRIKTSKLKWNIDAYLDTAMQVIDELAGKSSTVIKLKAIFLNNLLIEVKSQRKLNYVDKINSTINALNKKADVDIQFVKEKLHQIVLDTKFKTGNLAPDFSIIDTSGKAYTLKDFRGKKIYIDMGASWCTPCINGIPAWNKFVEENKGNENVIFIALSLDNTEKEWKTFLQKHPINGMRLFAGGGFKGSFATNYSIMGIPHFILLDEEGKIIQYAAPVPNDDRIKKLLFKQ